MDFFAIVSIGTYPTPTPTVSERMAYAVSYGLLDSLVELEIKSHASIFSMGLSMDFG